MVTHRRSRAVIGLVTALTVEACSLASGPTSQPATTRPAARRTCEEVRLASIPVDLRLADRRLVPYGPSLSGVDATYGGDGPGRSIRVMSGGYLDEVTEPYDDLRPSSVLRMGDVEVQELAGTFRGRPVRVALWREPDAGVPCDARAIVAVGVEAQEFRALLHHSG